MKKYAFLFLITMIQYVHAQNVNCNWAFAPTGTNTFNARVFNSTCDMNGNIVQSGKIYGVADMDPGTGPNDTSYSHMTYNYYLSKTDITGHLLWIKYFRGVPSISTFELNGLLVNSQNEIIVLGNYFGMIDFDFSNSGVDTLRSHQPTYQDYFVAKYDSLGNLIWVFNIGDANHQTQVQTLTLSTNDDIIIATNPNGAVDLDPSSAIHNSIGGNANLVCYDSNGNYKWSNNIAVTYSYALGGNLLECDAANNSYLLTVGYYELTVNKFDANGSRIWNKTIGQFSGNARVNPQTLLIDKSTGDFYVAGTFGGTVDFDPGTNSNLKTSSSSNYQDGFIAKYDSLMNPIWINTYQSNLNFGKYSLNYLGDKIIGVGQVTGLIDFGNGFTFTTSPLSPFYLKMDSSGNTINAFVLAGSGIFNTISIHAQNSILSGYFNATMDMDPDSTVVNLTSTNTCSFTVVYSITPNAIRINQNTPSLEIYPNPAENFIAVKNPSDEKFELKIYDLFGSLLLVSDNLYNPQSIDISALAKGSYFIKISNTKYQTVKKLQKL